PYTLLTGDLSGIQDYIFDISHIGAGGVARRLRARSFEIGVISDVISHWLLDKAGMPLGNVLMSAGGKFYLLLPNIWDTAQLHAHQRALDSWLLRRYNGEIGVNLAAVPFGSEVLAAERFGELTAGLVHALGEVKQHRLSSVLLDENGWT